MRVCVLLLWMAFAVGAAEKVSTNAPSLKAAGWEALFDGKTLKGWKETGFAGRGEVKVKDGQVIMEMGVMTGITWTNPVTRMNYEISVEAMRITIDRFGVSAIVAGADEASLSAVVVNR